MVGLTGCASLQDGAECPDLSGTYADQAERSTERLSALLLADQSAGNAARSSGTVSIAMDGERRTLVAVVGPQRALLKRGADFVCNAQGLRLLRPTRSRLDLGEMLVDEVSTFHTLRRVADGALTASTSAEERATIAGVPLRGPERPGSALRWKAVAAGTVTVR